MRTDEASLAGTRTLDDAAYRMVANRVYDLTGMDLNQYKPNQVKRLLDSVLRRHELDSYGTLIRRLRQDPAMLRDFKGRMSINVSEFFRDPVRFQHLDEVVIPDILRRTAKPAIWSAGSSIGCEAYSVAMILDGHGVLEKSSILGTDIDEEVISRAQGGAYWASELRNVPEEKLNGYFQTAKAGPGEAHPMPGRRGNDGEPEELYIVNAKVRRAVRYRVEDLFRSEYREEFDLIVCRNVTIYFTEEAKRGLYRRLCDALKPGGYLFVGGTEIIFDAQSLGLENAAPFFYRLSGSGASA